MPLFSSMTYIGEEMIRAISWTLLHSLWQGIVLALISACVIFSTKKASSALRYNLLVVALLAFVTGVAATFVTLLMNTTEAMAQAAISPVSPLNVADPFQNQLTVNQELTISASTINFINVNASWIVLVWLLIIGYKFIRLTAGLYQIYHLKKSAVSFAGEYWNNRLKELCRQLRVNKNVTLLQSGIIRIPSVIGYFKPVILFPVAMLNSMPVKEVEAILIHELGHIRRSDFLVNFLQNLVEIVFFFNPALLWVSALIKTERENCCDDIAVAHTANKQDYLKALLSLQEFSLAESQQLAIAFSGQENHVLNRVKRIIYNNNKTISNMEKKFLSAALILVSVCLFAFVPNETKDLKQEQTPILQPVTSNKIERNNPVIVHHERDTIPTYKVGGNSNMTGVTNTTLNGKSYKIVLENSEVTAMYCDGKKIPSEKIVTYKPILDKIYDKMEVDQAQSIRENEQAMRDREQATRDQEQATRDREQAIRDREQAIRDSDQAVKDRAQAEKDREMAMKDRAQAKGNQEQAAKDREQAIRDREQAIKEREQAVKDRAQAMKDREQAEKDREQAMKDRAQAVKDRAQAEQNMERITNELIAEHIIKERKDLHSLQLNVNEFIVNGAKQPAALHKKFKEKYLKSDTQTMVFESH